MEIFFFVHFVQFLDVFYTHFLAFQTKIEQQNRVRGLAKKKLTPSEHRTFLSISYQPPYIQKSLIGFLQSFDMPVFLKVRKQSHKFLNSGDSGPVVIRR